METEYLQSSARQRLERELKDINANPATHISFGPVKDDMFHWQGIIIGPEDTPSHIQPAIFHLSIQFPLDYPFNPPKVKFQTKVYHPNIDADGTVHINILEDQWSSALTIEKLLLSICSILSDPILENSQNPVSNLHRRDRIFYSKKARGWTKQILRCWSRIKLLLVVGRREMLSKHHPL